MPTCTPPIRSSGRPSWTKHQNCCRPPAQTEEGSPTQRSQEMTGIDLAAPAVSDGVLLSLARLPASSLELVSHAINRFRHNLSPCVFRAVRRCLAGGQTRETSTELPLRDVVGAASVQ